MEAEQLKWTACPARERPLAAIGAVAIILAISAATWLSFGPAWAAGATIVLIAALNRFFFASEFSMDAEAITARYPLRRQQLRWADVRRFVHDRHGGYLSTRARPSRLDGYRGMHLLFGSDRGAVIEAIEHRVTPTVAEGGRACPG